MRLRGGGGFFVPQSFQDMTKTEDIVFRGFSNEVPDWRIISDGLNLEGICLIMLYLQSLIF